jgi:glutathione synthase/RimK-type ligase-like ATP-grasp enzyme
MKLTIIARHKSWEVEQLMTSCKTHSVEVDVVDFPTLDEAISFDGWGDIVIWRNSSLDTSIGRTVLFNNLQQRGKLLINPGQAEYPFVKDKFFQQTRVYEYIKQNKKQDMHAIPTYAFKSIKDFEAACKNGKLQFPCIEKPSCGALGNGVRKISQIEDIVSVEGNIYQNFIENDGDYRVICLGGKVL